jgi:hypothetical protein
MIFVVMCKLTFNTLELTPNDRVQKLLMTSTMANGRRAVAITDWVLRAV